MLEFCEWVVGGISEEFWILIVTFSENSIKIFSENCCNVKQLKLLRLTTI